MRSSASAPPPPEPICAFRGFTDDPTALKFINSGMIATGSSSGELRLWNISTRRATIQVRCHLAGVQCIQLWKDLLITQGREGVIKVWDFKTSTNFSAISTLPIGPVSFCRTNVTTLSENGNLLLATADRVESQAKIYDLGANGTDCKEVAKLKPTDDLKCGMMMAIRFQENNFQSVITAHENGSLSLWDLRNCSQSIANTKLHSETMLCFAVEKNGKFGFSGSADNTIVRFQIHSDRIEMVNRYALPEAHPGINDIAIRSDQKIFSAAGWDHRVRIFSVKKFEPLAILKFHTAAVNCVDFCSSPSIEDSSPSSFSAAASSSANAPRGNLLASASSDKRVAVWSIY